jgi:glycosyltransferase involved in cell wall biosynthesis
MVTDFYHPFLGGVEQHVRHLGRALVERGHQVAVATLGQDGLAEEEWDQGVKVYRLRSATQRMPRLFSHPGRPWAPPFPDPAVSRQLAAVIERERPQIVHGHDWLARSFLPLKKGGGAKLVMSLHYYTNSCAKKNLMYQGRPCSGPALLKCLACGSGHYGAAKGGAVVLANWAMAGVERRAVDMFVAVSEATAEGNGLPGSPYPYRVIPNFLVESARPNPAEVEPYLAQLPDGPFFLFVGDIRGDKGINVLLPAYAQLHDALPHQAPPLVLIGKVWPETPAELPPNTRLLKNWPNGAVLAAWERCLAGVVPSVWPEPFGIVVIEAMSRGRPVIGARIGGIPEIVEDGRSGLLVEAGHVDELSRAMGRLAADPALAACMGQAAQQRSRLYTAGAVVPQIERVYGEVMGRKGHNLSHQRNSGELKK